MATKKSKTVEPTVEPTVGQAKEWEPIIVNHALDDVGLYADQFNGRPQGRYVMTFQTPFSTQSLSVYWDGEKVIL
jgi:hypothetical protein